MEYKCPSCTYLSDSITLLHVHCVNAHPKEFFTCPWCTVPFATLRVLQKHAPKCSALDKNEPREGEINTVLVNNDTCLVCEVRHNLTWIYFDFVFHILPFSFLGSFQFGRGGDQTLQRAASEFQLHLRRVRNVLSTQFQFGHPLRYEPCQTKRFIGSFSSTIGTCCLSSRYKW